MRKAVLSVALGVAVSLLVADLSAQSPRRKRTRKSTTSQKTLTPCADRLLSFEQFLAENKGDWVIATTDKGTTYFYNPRKMLCDDKGILKVWVKAVKQDLKEAGNYSISRYDLKCEVNQVRILSQTEYNGKGEVTSDFTSDDPKWQDVVPDSVGEGILETVCNKKV
jgi:hypothetical protein